MGHYRYGALHLEGTSLELWLSTDDGRVAHVELDVPPHTAHALQHLVAVHHDPDTGRRRCRVGRSVLDRALTAVGAVPERIEVRPGQPPRFCLAVVDPRGCLQRVDLDLADTVELLAVQRVPVVAVGWPPHDWDAALDRLQDDASG